ncbi:MAG: ABC transporter ATP-binding protein, partial [Bacteroidota bacterium]
MMKKGILLKTFRGLLNVLPQNFKKKGLLVSFLLLVNSILDLLGLSALLPLFLLILEENATEKYSALKSISDFFGLETESSLILGICVGILAVVVIKNVLSLFIVHYQARFSFGLNRYFAVRLYRKYYSRGFLYFKETNSNNITRDVNQVPNSFSINVVLPFLSVVNELIVLTFICVGLLAYDWNIIALLAVILVPTFLLFYAFSKRKVQFIAERLFELSPKIRKVLYESIFGYSDVKMSNTEEQFFGKYEGFQSENVRLQAKNHVFKMAPTKVIESTLFFGVIIIVSYGVLVLQDKKALTAMIGIFVLAAYRVLPSINRIMMAIMSIKAYQYTFDVLNRIHEINPEEGQEDLELTFKEKLTLSNVSFTYPNKKEQVLNQFNLVINKGETVGIVGESGSGKTTLINLLLKFIDPDKGEITLDGRIIGRKQKKSWRKLVGYVQQDVFLLDGTIAQNVAFAEEHIDENKVIESLKKAQLWDLIEQFPKGIYNAVGEQGAQLSGGQKQRLGIARALYQNAQILVFDEATAALDNKTERELTDACFLLSCCRERSRRFVFFGSLLNGVFPCKDKSFLVD